MIQIHQSKVYLDTLAQQHYNDVLLTPFSIANKLNAKIHSHGIPNEKKVLYRYLFDNLSIIITGDPGQLEVIIAAADPLLQQVKDRTVIGLSKKLKRDALNAIQKEIFGIFDYDLFVRKDDGKFAYELADNLDVSVCLYCNRTYTVTHKQGKTRPTFDHFFSRKYHPYLALSFYNLVPSCYVCNNSKSSRKINTATHIHPYTESFFERMNFVVDITDADFINGKFSSFTLKTEQHKKCSTADYGRVERNLALFKLKELYGKHKLEAAEIIQKSYVYTVSRLDELQTYTTASGIALFDSREEVIEFAFGNYFRSEMHGKKVLAKFTSDIANDLMIRKIILTGP
jgi:5-methylcytosine-specific restriction endonuclease McrA